jgi:hypothetical protein
MRRIVILFLVFILRSQAQQVIIEGGASLSHNGSSQNELIIKGDTSGFYTVTSNTLQSAPKTLRKFSYKVRRLIFDKEIFYIGNSNISVVHGSFFEGKLALALEVNDDQKKKKFLVLRNYFYDTGMDKATDILLDSMDYDPADPKFNFKVLTSPDLKKLYALKIELKKGREKLFTVSCFDALKGNKLWKQLDPDSSYFLKGNALLDEDGKLFTLIKDPADRFTLRSFSDQKTAASALPSPYVEIVDATIELVEGKLFACGQYTCEKAIEKTGEAEQSTVRPRKEKKTELGFFLIEFDKNSLKASESSFDKMSVRIQNQLSYKFKSKILRNVPGKTIHYYEKPYQHYKSFYFKGDLYVVNFHGYLIAGEVVSRNEIIILKYSGAKLEWMTILPGKNSCPDKLGIGIILGKKLNLVYFDHKDNLIYYPDAGFYYPNKYKNVGPLSAILVRIGINENGTFERENIFTYVDWQLNFDPSKNISKPGTLIIGGKDAKKLRYDVLRLVE